MRVVVMILALGIGGAMFAACGDDDAERTPTPSPVMVEVSLFFANADSTGEVEVKRQVSAPAELGDVIELLLEGPTVSERDQLGAIQAIPEGTELISAEVSDGLATLDLSGELLDYGGGSARVLAIEASIRRTATALDNVDEVLILVEGRPDALQP